MKNIITWNVNGIRAIEKKGFADWLMKESPEILCIQETKAHPEQLGRSLLEIGPYKSYWESAEKRGYSGVATYTKSKPLETRVLGVDAFDSEGRVQVLIFDQYAIINGYFPNSQEAGKRIDYKIAYCNTLLEQAEKLVKEGHNVIICGDYNIAHKPIDLKNPTRNEKNPGYLPQEREWMEHFLNSGFSDTFRMFNQEPDNYTWWSYRFRSREKNIGWRIDYHCVNESFKSNIQGCEILADVMGSDHCPVRITVK
ncbi:MAG: exodeoxyribonuclease III [Chlamydiota bacterium]|nr:exodeoxyribonuclease III [Chlamydiota bacterium]